MLFENLTFVYDLLEYNSSFNAFYFILIGFNQVKGEKKKRLPPQKWPLLDKFLQYIHVTPITGSEIL